MRTLSRATLLALGFGLGGLGGFVGGLVSDRSQWPARSGGADDLLGSRMVWPQQRRRTVPSGPVRLDADAKV